MHVVIVGGGAALAQPLIEHYLQWQPTPDPYPHRVTTFCRGKDLFARDRLKTVHSFSDVFGEIDILVTMTGAVFNAKLENMTAEWWYESLEANLSVPAKALMALLPKVVDGGSVVVVGSVVGSTGGVGCANYAAAKAGLVGLVRAAANEVAHRGVCVNLLELGYVNAGMGARLDPKVREKVLQTIPLRRFAEPAEFVAAVDFLGKCRYATGTTLTLAGGLR